MAEAPATRQGVELIMVVEIGTNVRLCVFCWQDDKQVPGDLMDAEGRSVCDRHRRVVVGA